jgi:diacylglycerol kinase
MAHKRVLAFGYALKGIKVAWQEEAHFKFHVIAAATALLLSWYLQISKNEFFVVLIMIGIVMSAEIFNAALEELCDKYSTSHDPHLGKIKDLSAAAVLVSSTIALVVGVIIFGPRIITFI